MEKLNKDIIIYGHEIIEDDIYDLQTENYINNEKPYFNINKYKIFYDILKKIKDKNNKEIYFLDYYKAYLGLPNIKAFNYIVKCIKEDNLENINFNNSFFNRKQYKRLEFIKKFLFYTATKKHNRYLKRAKDIIENKLKENRKFILKINKINKENIKLQKLMILEIKNFNESNIELLQISIQDQNKKAYFDSLIEINQIINKEL